MTAASRRLVALEQLAETVEDPGAAAAAAPPPKPEMPRRGRDRAVDIGLGRKRDAAGEPAGRRVVDVAERPELPATAWPPMKWGMFRQAAAPAGRTICDCGALASHFSPLTFHFRLRRSAAG